MKMIIAIIRDSESDSVSQGLTSAGYRVTLVASSGGFLRRGNSTILVGVDDDQLEPALQIIRDHVKEPTEEGMHKATIFVLKVDQYTHY
ncbi:MAG: hypothetical protein HPY76_09945 [Anaerolineae bacterium]|jgi:uncharacterized protein YaaQ|nr:hypothetical protein [Anaerolineae bacterium]